ncbi:MAG: nickel pincer cofactor biosynthesis protein LarB [Deltaproteobacteria bacterium]|nr:nickel pincer cofactor biosynthesis protein LarB [Deltaproteobacteria bacterium]
MEDKLKALFERVAQGELSSEQAADAFTTELRAADGIVDLGFAQLDIDRSRRTGVSEVIFASGKTTEQLLALIDVCLQREGRVLATRVSEAQAEAVCARFPTVTYNTLGRILRAGAQPNASPGRVAVLTAGTSDQNVGEEAAEVLSYLGHEVDRIFDVGVAGIHRLFHALERIREAHALVVAAGMEGALPSVVAGLVSCPVIAVPTSVGYGASFGGLSALLAMLNACAPGIGVVNIDNGFGAAMLAHRVASARGES